MWVNVELVYSYLNNSENGQGQWEWSAFTRFPNTKMYIDKTYKKQLYLKHMIDHVEQLSGNFFSAVSALLSLALDVYLTE